MDWFGISYPDDDIPESLLDEVNEKAEELREEAMEKLDEYLETKGLESVQGFLLIKH